jgi:hypothetical protein
MITDVAAGEVQTQLGPDGHCGDHKLLGRDGHIHPRRPAPLAFILATSPASSAWKERGGRGSEDSGLRCCGQFPRLGARLVNGLWAGAPELVGSSSSCAPLYVLLHPRTVHRQIRSGRILRFPVPSRRLLVLRQRSDTGTGRAAGLPRQNHDARWARASHATGIL